MQLQEYKEYRSEYYKKRRLRASLILGIISIVLAIGMLIILFMDIFWLDFINFEKDLLDKINYIFRDSWLKGFYCIVGMFLGILAIVWGNKSKKNGYNTWNKYGIACGWIGTILEILYLIVLVIAVVITKVIS